MTAGDEKTRGEAGFTLLEVLVSLALLALIVALLPASIRLGRRAWETGARLEHTSRNGVIADVMSTRLSQALAVAPRDDSGRLKVAFAGDGDGVRFVAPSTGGPTGTGLVAYELRARAAQPGRNALVLRWAPYRPVADRQHPPEWQERELDHDVVTFRLRYLARGGQEDGGWSPIWTREDALPDAVEIVYASRTDARAVRTTVEVLARTAR